MTIQRLARLVETGDVAAVTEAVATHPRLLGRSVERFGDDGWTPLHLAVATGNTELVELLVATGADLVATTDRGRTPLHVALQHAPGLVDVLCRLGAPVDAASAAYLGHVDRLQAALDDGTPLVDRVTAVHLLDLAAQGGSLPAVELLLERGADVDCGALQAAAREGHLDVLRALIEAGAQVDRRDADTGQAALHAAVATTSGAVSLDVVRALLAAGADVEASTADGATALDISRVAAARDRASSSGASSVYEELTELLVAHGAVH